MRGPGYPIATELRSAPQSEAHPARVHALAATLNLALAISLLALTLSTLRGARYPARFRSWVFFSIASFTLLMHSAIDAFGGPELADLSALFEVGTLSFLALGFVLLYGSDRERLRRLEGEADHDANTGLYNRRAFGTIVAERLAKQRPDGRAALALLDLDGFKQVNDALGHPRGDELLQVVAATLRANLRQQDVAARYGGDEFVVYFESCGVADAQRVLQRVRTSVASVSGGAGAMITISAGVASYPDSARDLDALIVAADRALIEGKRTGKDQVRVAGSARDRR